MVSSGRKNTYKKNILRELNSTKSRLISFFGIIMLGVMMLTGLMSVAPDMKNAGNRYFRAQNLCDLRLISTLGFSEDDVAAIAAVEGVAHVMPVRTLDCEVTTQQGDTLVARLQAMPADPLTDDPANMNRLMLQDGRWPENESECVADWIGFVVGIQLGDELTVAEENDSLTARTFTVVGIVQDPIHFSVDSDSSTAGDGNLDLVAYVDASAFSMDYYTTCYVTVEGASALNTYTDEYAALIDPVQSALEDLSEGRVVIRRAQLVDDAYAQLDDAKAEYADAKAEVEQELADAEQKLADAERELADAKSTLERGEREYEDGQRQLAEQKQALPGILQENANTILVSEEGVMELEEQIDSLRLAVAMVDMANRMLELAEQGMGYLPTPTPTALPTGSPAPTDTASPTAPAASAAAMAARGRFFGLRLLSATEPTPVPPPTPEPVPTPTPAPTDAPTPEPTAAATPEGTSESAPTATPEETLEPTASPTTEPGTEPTAEPTARPRPTVPPLPTALPSALPTALPSALPTALPSFSPIPGLDVGTAQILYAYASSLVAEYQAQLDEAKVQLYKAGVISSPNVSNEELVSQSSASLRRMKLALLQGQLQIATAQAEAYAAFESAAEKLADARQTLDDGWQAYEDGLVELADGRAEFEEAKADAEQQLRDAEQKILDAEEQIDDIAAGEWYVLDRDTIVSYVTFAQNADRIAAIARVFPVFFFLVAALVASTTMTRMVEENRLQMGALKALGYSDFAITGKYLLFGLAASLLGSLVGIFAGFAGFPSVIWYAYSIMYSVPGFQIVFYPGLIVASLLISAAIIGLTTFAACHASLSEKPAALLLPKAPAAGKRILLERITPVWSRMKFSNKTTARNLFRYKKRFFMTVLGVAGCAALLLVGFGIQDSIMQIVDKQYTELYHSDLSITISSEKALTLEHGITETLDTDPRIQSWGVFYSRTMSVYNADNTEASMTVMAARDPSDLTRYITLRTRNGHRPISFDENSVILTEKTSETLGISVGDTLWVQSPSGARVPLTVTGITENYLFSRLYLSQEKLEEILGAPPVWNTILAATTCEDTTASNALKETILRKNYITTAAFAEETTSTFSNTISCINYVVLLVIFCAAALAAVVLYNLINVNLAERKKELATIKVLGFFDREVYRYIFREIELLSLIGSGVGLLIGVPLHQFIIRTVEIDQMMFIRAIDPSSYLYSVALTMVFSVAMCFLMRPQVRQISMVESMKAPE